MFDHRHYVPVLRWKQAERFALKQLFDADRRAVTPLIELCPKDFAICRGRAQNAVNEVLSHKATEICDHWPERPAFVDLIHLEKYLPRLRAA